MSWWVIVVVFGAILAVAVLALITWLVNEYLWDLRIKRADDTTKKVDEVSGATPVRSLHLYHVRDLRSIALLFESVVGNSSHP